MKVHDTPSLCCATCKQYFLLHFPVKITELNCNIGKGVGISKSTRSLFKIKPKEKYIIFTTGLSCIYFHTELRSVVYIFFLSSKGVYIGKLKQEPCSVLDYRAPPTEN